jgi:Tfp pilus assembly protein PilO
MKLDKHVITWLVGIVLVTAAFLSLVTGPQMSRIQTVMDQIDSEEHDQEVADETSHRIAVLEREVTRLQERTAAFSDQIPVGENLGRFLQDLGRFAEQRQVQLGEIEPGDPLQSDKVIALPITFNVHGPFKQVFDLIQDVEQMPRLTLVERLETSTDDQTPGTVTAQLRLRVYFRTSQIRSSAKGNAVRSDEVV